MAGTRVVAVFADGPGGGNPAPVVLDADGLTDAQMRDIARAYGLETAFVVPAAGTGCDVALRFWVPNHEMSMCGHATVGAVWLLAHDGALSGRDLAVHTRSGVVRARIRNREVAVSQPPATIDTIADGDVVDAVLSVLGIGASDLADRPIRNSTTSRTKTLVPLRDGRTLDQLAPDFARVEAVCASIESTGLYPYAPSGDARFDARQFPASSGYPEDAATGIAAAALTFALLADGLAGGRPVTVRQGRAMGRPSRITVELERSAAGVECCWLSGPVALLD